MEPHDARILAVNAGSSSIKFALFAADEALQRVAHGAVERIGLAQSALRTNGTVKEISAADHAAAAEIVLDWIGAQGHAGNIVAVAHRIVHGGPNYHLPQRMTARMLDDLRDSAVFDEEHLPGEILLAQRLRERFGNVPHIACFDTDFHWNLPRVAKMLAIPRRYEALGVRRYGFHGLSYAYLAGELARLAGKAVAPGRVVLCHLGNGASLAAIRDGEPIDTTMALTPAAGIAMSTRAGDLDPGLGWFLARKEGMSPRQFDTMVNFHSGLLGISETSSDMRDLLALAVTDPRAREAVLLFCYQVRKTLGAFAAALGGLDTVVFSGGIGENAPEIRARICEGLEFLGIALDGTRNAANAALISEPARAVTVRVMPTDEERMMAEIVRHVLNLDADGRPKP